MNNDKEKDFSLRVSEIAYPETTFIMKSFLDEDERSKIYEFIEEHQKNKLYTYDDNLKNVERTDWHYHLHDDFRPYYDIVLKKLYDCMMRYSLRTGQTSSNDRPLFEKMLYKIFMLNSWYAKCRKNAIVQPHNHGYGYSLFSFACYLKIPSLKSSLFFGNTSFTWIKSLDVREGDIIVFPSHLLHWTNDVEEGRALFSGNFVWEVMHHCECPDCLKIKKLDEKVFFKEE